MTVDLISGPSIDLRDHQSGYKLSPLRHVPMIWCAPQEEVVPNPTPLHAEWDSFIDALDRAGQGGSAEAIEIPPALAIAGIPAGTRFGELSSDQVNALVRLALELGRRGDIVRVLWRDMRDRARWKKASARREGRKRR